MTLLKMKQVQAFFTHHSRISISNHKDEVDDDASVASTVTTTSSQLSFSSQEDQEDVFASHIDTTSSPSSFSFSTKKSVCFDESRNEAFDNTQICREECEEFWYSAQDFCQFKESTHLYADAVCASEKRCGGGGPCSYERVIKRVYMACCQAEATEEDSDDGKSSSVELLPLSLTRPLNRWMSSSSAVNRLGMERLIVRTIRKDRSQRRKQVVRAVLDIQELENMNQVVSSNNYTNVSERMRLASQSLSRPSRLFSRHMAQAQASCAIEQTDNM